MASNIYLKIDEIKGNSTTEEGKDKIELLYAEVGVTMPCVPAPSPSVASIATGRPDFDPISIWCYVDSTTPQFQVACATGQQLKKATVEYYQQAGDKPIPYYTIEMEDCRVVSVDLLPASLDALDSGAADSAVDPTLLRGARSEGEPDRPQVFLELTYNKISWKFAAQDPNAPGGAKGNVAAGFDLEKNKKV